jgi:hypothetical protein
MIKRCIFSLLTVVILVIGMTDVSGAVPVVSYTNTCDSGLILCTYEATVFNDTTDYLFDLFLSPTAMPLDAADMTAYGWGIADIGTISPDYFVHWMADFGEEIPSGGTKSGFWFTYIGSDTEDLGSIPYSVLWGLDSATGDPYIYDGDTILATPVPEPATWGLLVSGLIGSVAFWWKPARRR